MKNTFSLYIAYKYFRSRKKTGVISLTSIITIIGVFLGSFAIIASMGVLNGFQDVIFDRATDIEPSLRVFVKHLEYEEREHMREQLLAMPDILAVSPVIERKIIISSGDEQQILMLKGIEPDSYSSVVNIESYLFSERYLHADLEQTEKPEIIIGVTTANLLGIHSGDDLELIDILSATDGLPETMSCRVRDIFQIDIFDYDGAVAYMHLADMQYLLDDPGYHYLDIKLKDGIVPEAYSEYLSKELAEGCRISSWKESHTELFAAMRMEKAGTFIVLNLIIILAGFNLIASLMMLLLEKRWETGILKSMGLSNRESMKIYLFLGWINGGIGLITGTGLSVGLLLIQQYFPFVTLPQDVYFIKYLPVHLNVSDVLITVLTLFVIITISSIVPAFRINQLKPIESIKVKA